MSGAGWRSGKGCGQLLGPVQLEPRYPGQALDTGGQVRPPREGFGAALSTQPSLRPLPETALHLAQVVPTLLPSAKILLFSLPFLGGVRDQSRGPGLSGKLVRSVSFLTRPPGQSSR